jgi:hypothetical protein
MNSYKYGRIDGWPGNCWLNEITDPSDNRSDTEIIKESEEYLSKIDEIWLDMEKTMQEITKQSDVYRKATNMNTFVEQRYNTIIKFKKESYSDPKPIVQLKEKLSEQRGEIESLNQTISINRARLYDRHHDYNVPNFLIK